MIFTPPPVTHEEFVVGCAPQRPWGWSTLIATAFFLGKVGAGTFLVSLILSFPPGMLMGLFIAVVCKGVTHLLYLGRKERFWRIAMHPQSSWISRGIWAMAVLAVFGLWILLITAGWFLPGGTSPGLATTVRVIAVTSALFVIVYDGFVLSASPAIPLWNSALLPVLCLSYGTLGGVVLTALTMEISGQPIAGSLRFVKLALLVANLIVVVSYVVTAFNATAPARAAIQLLVRGRYWPLFWGGVVLLGLTIPLLIGVVFAQGAGLPIVIALAVADIVGHFLIFYVLLRSALYSPVY